MHIVAVANQKGGSGKTATSVNLAATLAEGGSRVLLLDCDAQANATAWLGIDYTNLDRSVYEVFTQRASVTEVTQRTGFGFDAAPAVPELTGAEVALAGVVGREHVLAEAMPSDGYDWVVCDCSPSLGIVTLNVLAAATDLLVPVPCDVLALEGVAQLVRVVEQVRRRLNPRLSVLGLLPTFHTRRYRLADEALAAMRQLGPRVLKTVIRETVRLKEAPGLRAPVTVTDPRGNSAADYRALAGEVGTLVQ